MPDRNRKFVGSPGAGGRSVRASGRPRDPAIDAAIIDAAQRLLADRGYGGMSLEAVAAVAGTSIPAVRRRYRDRAALASAAIVALRFEPLPAATIDPRGDAVAILRNFAKNASKPRAMAIVATLLVEEERHPELLEQFREQLVRPRRAAVRRTLARGVASRQLPADLDVAGAANALIGNFYSRYIAGDPLGRNWAERTLTLLWPRDRRVSP